MSSKLVKFLALLPYAKFITVIIPYWCRLYDTRCPASSHIELPKTPLVIKYFERFYNIYLAYVVFKYTCSERLAAALEVSPPDKLRCYLVGSFIFHDYIDDLIGFMYALTLLAWRSYQHYYAPNHPLAMYVFLLISEQDLYKVYKKYLTLGSLGLHKQARMKNITEREQTIASFVCHQVNLPNDLVCLKVRPNRSLAAKFELQNENAQFVVRSICTGIILAILVLPIVAYKAIDHQRYLRKYPKCEQLSEWHETFTMGVDFLESYIILSEMCLLLLSGWTTVYLLNQDILIYWRQLELKLDSLTRRVCEASTVPRIVRSTMDDCMSYFSMEFQEEIYELQVECYDFFKQISTYNLIISNTITWAICGWLMFFVILGHYTFNYYELHDDSYALPGLWLLMLAFHFVYMTRGSLSLSETHSKCLKTYQKLCTLMAHDQSQHKERFVQLLDFCLARKRAVYTFFGHFPYTHATYLSIFGWSLSGFLILESLFRRQ